jgi:hypothetical protein
MAITVGDAGIARESTAITAGGAGIARESTAITAGDAGIARHTAITVGLGRVLLGGWGIGAAGGDAELGGLTPRMP